MTIRMSSKQWEALPLEGKEVLKVLGILDLVKPKKKGKSKALPLLKPYVLKRTATCNVCKTKTINYFKMISIPGKQYLTSIKIQEKDILPNDIIKEGEDLYSGCLQCYTILSKKTKEELIKQIIQLSK